MSGHDPSEYGDAWAGIYDETHPRTDDATSDCVNVLAELAGDGRVLELGIGTGRVAIPLALRGVYVHGIEASDAMLDTLRAKLRSLELATVEATSGDFSRTFIDKNFRVAFCGVDTFFDLMTQEAQLRCFRNVAAHLEQDGVFVIEAFMPNLSRFSEGQAVRARTVSRERVEIEVATHADPFDQVVESQMVRIADGRVELFPIYARYVWPSEMDLMALLAGLRLRERWSGWKREPVGARSESHVSIYEKVGEPPQSSNSRA